MSDLISRQAAIDALTDDLSYYGNGDERAFGMSRAIGIIEKLPPAQPEKRTEERMETHACDCISRQMLLEYIHGEPVGRLLCDKYNLDGLIEQFPSAQPKWIPVTERLPEEDLCTGYGRQYSESVLMTAHNTIDDEDIVDYGHTVDGRWFSDTTDAYIPDNWDVTAWQKLPEPYKGEQG